MTDREILNGTIEKVVTNGWTYSDFTTKEMKRFITVGSIKNWTQVMYEEKTYHKIIFSHSFAKAFWGEEKWKFHLQQMVLEENPLQYLIKFLDGNKNE